MMSENFLNDEVYRKSLVTLIAYMCYCLELKFSSLTTPEEALSSLEKYIFNRLIAENAAILHPFAYDDMRNCHNRGR